jgi:hypothetical protein
MGALGALIVLSLASLCSWALVVLADKRGRNELAWGFAGFFFGPLALIALLIAGDTEQERLRKAEADEVARLRARSAAQ